MRIPGEVAELAAENGFGAYVLTTVEGSEPRGSRGSALRPMMWTIVLVAGVWMIIAAETTSVTVLGSALVALVAAVAVRAVLRERRSYAARPRLHCFEGGVVVRRRAYPWPELEITEWPDTVLVGQGAIPRRVVYRSISAGDGSFLIGLGTGGQQIRDLAERGGATIEAL
ncbi:hypothetical protein A8924_0948 [Saccharopolyspora erythraea NRRL 2338]|uniref:Uncharacterized protein n=2 Tax=Saccharopolyspora erythraea TaxID=1836 RepID=A4F770_SACEN|nr:hypothetical protein [Saccharopolyspora erythraea]EQD86385.1 hypothetical protein N599_10105 [Saccharopolyspora erythraea D]PFG93697.1 hypothetical protein A8924_0948 [Saccharopolyspora erythraea NRRL 2338]QRK90541.1 hypothetical protein JQX30_03290 [Saccharopolyspora erythraea]CAL99894.1 hypothetical protein SACE_0548 [Saccharopolyspora erythraea NRRL 2338]